MLKQAYSDIYVLSKALVFEQDSVQPQEAPRRITGALKGNETQDKEGATWSRRLLHPEKSTLLWGEEGRACLPEKILGSLTRSKKTNEEER